MPAVQVRQKPAERFVLQSTDVELAAQDGLKQGVIVSVKEIEAGIGSLPPCVVENFISP
ncbi:MAG: hypothetical protein NTY38_02770 [Acidobacteria bacterium]|nr:hypothetical protein [Acidobacteriota bacterium]